MTLDQDGKMLLELCHYWPLTFWGVLTLGKQNSQDSRRDQAK
jgi:hypothetical protein